METKQSSIAPYHSTFAKPHPPLSDPIECEIRTPCLRIPFHADILHITEAEGPLTADSLRL